MHTHGSLFVNARAFPRQLEAQTLESSNNEDGFVLNGLFVVSQGVLTLLVCWQPCRSTTVHRVAAQQLRSRCGPGEKMK